MKFWNLVKSGGKREPVRTLRELADELGLTLSQLKGHLSATPIDRPKPIMETTTTNNRFCTNRRINLYSRREFRIWWVKHLKIINHKDEEA